MSSQINPYNIDGTYPVAGQDNNSQGFRDNFTNTKNNLVFAKSEIEDLQAKVILKSALTGTSLDNDFSGAAISNAKTKGFRATKYDLGSVSGSQTINFSNGSFQTMTTSDSITIASISNWPNVSGTAVTIDLGVTVTSTSYTLTFPSAVSMGSAAGVSSKTITFTATGTYFFELVSIDGGTSYYLIDKTRAYNAVQGSFSVTGDTTLTGNLTTGGARIVNGFQYNSSATSGFTLTVNNNVERLIFDTASALTSGTITLPSANVANSVVTISSTADIANLKVQGSGGTTVSPNANITLSAGTGVSYFYHATETKWYKVS